MVQMYSDFLNNAERFISWYKDEVLPLWIDRCYDPVHGGFFEALNFDGSPAADLDRRVRVQARQIYVMSQVADLGWYPQAAPLAKTGYDFFLTKACPDNGATGCVHTLNPTGEIINDLRDLYDNAFLLLACSSLFRLTGREDVLALADRTLDFLDADFHAANGGWQENDHHDTPRRQNPHMHLFEAFMALYDATKQEKYGRYADQVFQLFTDRFYDAEHGVLREFFEADWSTAQGSLGTEIEPGHMMEWVYLLRVYEKLRGSDVNYYCETLYATAKEIGTAPGSVFLVDKLQIGAVPAGNRRLWPQTEFIKAACLSAPFTNNATLEDASALIDACFKTYFAEKVSGLWCDQFDEAGNRIAPNAPASILYHLLDAVLAVHDTAARLEESKT